MALWRVLEKRQVAFLFLSASGAGCGTAGSERRLDEHT